MLSEIYIPHPDQERLEARAKLLNPYYLPTYKDISCAFPNEPHAKYWDDWSYFFDHAEKQAYEILTVEFINKLAEYLGRRLRELGFENPTILEIGAGNGRLSHFLRLTLNLTATQAQVVATDSGKWEEIKPVFPVEKLNHAQALKKYSPQIVITSWMPYKADWTQEIRNTTSVQEYLLIGETAGGCCGDDWLTWGWKSFEQQQPADIAPYTKDGFEYLYIEEISKTQICCRDRPGSFIHSSTASFRRIQK